MINCTEKLNLWLKNVKDEDLKEELNAMQNNTAKIEESFYKTLEFGTAGLRGIMGAGTNKMNKYVIMQTTKAIADYLNAKKSGGSVAITYDSRINSENFAHLTASVFASFGIKCYITKGCKPTPYLSFLIRNLKADMGVNITSSHNPKIYNGYKVYDNQGCQIGEDVAGEISAIREKINPFKIEIVSFEELLANGKIEYVDSSKEDEYLNAVYNQRVLSGNVDINKKIVYTALNGVGEPFVTRILSKLGYNDLIYVKEQKMPNGEFSTCPYPNPELDDAVSLAIKYAKDNGADYVLASDPDCDRLSVVYRDNDSYVHLTGNQIGTLFTEFIFRNLKSQGRLPSNPVLIRSIVTTAWVDKIVKEYNGEVEETYTGFKNLCAVVRKLELAGQVDRAVFAFEDACGYVKGSYVRDKDGVLASMLFAELISELETNGLTITDRLNEIRQKYGDYDNQLYSVRFEGLNGEMQKNKILHNLHIKPITNIGGQKVIKCIDFLKENELNLPSSDVLKYVLDSGDNFIIRPSGTEPLLKCYINVQNDKNREKMNAIKNDIDKIFNA